MNTRVDPDLKFWLETVQRELLPKMESSAMAITIFSGKIDAKICVEVGAAVLFDKPIVLLAIDGDEIPAALKRCAHTIVYGNPYAEETKAKLKSAISAVLSEDRRPA